MINLLYTVQKIHCCMYKSQCVQSRSNPQYLTLDHEQNLTNSTLYKYKQSLVVQGIFAKIGPDLELRWGDLISSPVDSIVSLVSPKKSYGPNSVGENYFSATPFSLLAKNATGGHNA